MARGAARTIWLLLAVVLPASSAASPGAAGTVANVAPAADPRARGDEEPEYLSWSRPGQYRAPHLQQFDVESLAPDQKLVTTYFFYWYDAATDRDAQARRTFDPYRFHPPNMETVSFYDPDWYEREFSDMLAAVDFVLTDYWGEPGQYPRRVAPAPELNYFATEGLYAWGAAPFGFADDPQFTIAQVGPGFSNRQFNRPDPIHTDRRGGRYYEDQLRDLTRRYVDRFKAGLGPP